ncbi:MAG: ADP-ribosylglycohydrolase family protein [Saprospiraceae bacterium]|nr:ADP-ribosylglycohydrolase family protein [Saprospiraceae bacterium]
MLLPRYFVLVFLLCFFNYPATSQVREITRDDLRDKINGGLLGQFFGNLNGLPHENKYFEEPGNIREYTPDLSEGAFTDDDTDIEFVYVYHMLQEDELILPYERIKTLWEQNINEYIWCSNLYARNLMSLDIYPPYTGNHLLNPWADFNISGQFLCEQFGLISPGMPETAARIGSHYTQVAVDGEPVQTTQFFDAIIAMAFFEQNIVKLIDAGLQAVDADSEISTIANDVRTWYSDHPEDWKKTRSQIKEKYWSGTWGGPGGSNGYRTITAATIGALLHGNGDFVESLRIAFNFGWDADNISAMVGTIVGLVKGEQWIRSHNWEIKDQYLNNRRTALPPVMTITEFAALHYNLAERLIMSRGGKEIELKGKPGYRFTGEDPRNVIPLKNGMTEPDQLKKNLLPQIEKDISSSDSTALARGFYLAVCLGLENELSIQDPQRWQLAKNAIRNHPFKFFEDEQWSKDQQSHFKDILDEDR